VSWSSSTPQELTIMGSNPRKGVRELGNAVLPFLDFICIVIVLVEEKLRPCSPRPTEIFYF
jgi:hypothetical protein